MYRVPDNQEGGKSKDDNANKDRNNKDRRQAEQNLKNREVTDSQGRKILVQCNEEYLGMVAFASKIYELKNK